MFTELEFLDALSQLLKIVEEPREYRLHYDETGGIYLCTMQNHPMDTTYLVVDEKTYLDYACYQIVNGKLKRIDNDPGYRVQLKRSSQGYRVVNNHAGIILADDEEYENVEYYDNN